MVDAEHVSYPVSNPVSNPVALGFGSRLGPYEIERVIGRGGMGVVLAALHVGLQRRVALKVLPAATAQQSRCRRRFAREAAALARIDSPHVVACFELGEADGFLYLATQRVDGGDLEQRLRQRGPLPLAEVAALGAQLAEALSTLHDAGIVHRDLKPANVLLRGRAHPERGAPHAYLCDFGLARLPEDTQESAEGIGSGGGTLAYLAPERLLGQRGDAASDVYALGCALHAMASGQAPFLGSDADVIAAHLDAPAPRLPGADPLSARLNNLISDCLAKNPAARPGAEAVHVRLRLAVEQQSIGPRRSLLRSASPTVATALVAALLALIAVLAVAAAPVIGHSTAPDQKVIAAPAPGAEVVTDTYRFAVPRGWAPSATTPAGTDGAWVEGNPATAFAANLNVVLEAAPAETDLTRLSAALMAAQSALGVEHATATHLRSLDGVTAVERSGLVHSGERSYRIQQFVAVHDGSVLTLTFSHDPSTTAAGRSRNVEAVLVSFAWQ